MAWKIEFELAARIELESSLRLKNATCAQPLKFEKVMQALMWLRSLGDVKATFITTVRERRGV
jgi:hypothetical protein